MNKKGQALVEFLIILPVFVMLLLSIIDFGNIIYNKNHLENVLSQVIEFVDEKEIDEINLLVNKNRKNKIIVLTESVDSQKKITLNQDVNILTPGLNLILSSPYKISTSIILQNE